MYRVEPNGDIVITGFEKGIGESPYSGLTDLKSVNIGSVPGEAAVNFSTQSVTTASTYATLTATAFGDGQTVTITGLNNSSFVEVGQVVTVSSSTITGMTTGTLYFVETAVKDTPIQERAKFSLAYGSTGIATIGTTGSATLTTVDPARPKFFTTDNFNAVGSNFMLDASGRVWSDGVLTTGGTGISATSSWTYTGNTTFSDSNGDGLTYWRTNNASSGHPGDWDGWLFVFRDGFIDYSNVNGVGNGTVYSNLGTYVYGWNPSNGTTGTTTAYLTGASISACPHGAIVGPDGNVYFPDSYTMGKIEQFDKVTPVRFAPTNTATYIYTHAHNLPIEEISTCIAPLGTNFIIGGVGNQAYIWNGVDQLTITNPILLAESYVAQIVTVNTNAYIFCGNRGNVYVTNGAQANVYKKVPDHISNTVAPYFTWGGATYQKDKLFFGVYVTDNAGTAISGYGGVWSIDLITDAMSLTNQLSYGSYSGYPTAFSSIPPLFNLVSGLPNQPTGTGLFIGWSQLPNTGFGIDSTSSTPYTGGQSYVVSDAIPIGTYLKKQTSHQFEYKLSTPLLATESIELQAAPYVGSSFTSLGSTSGSNGGTTVSDNFANKLDPTQWVLVKAIQTSRATTPSYCRLTELRIVEGVK